MAGADRQPYFEKTAILGVGLLGASAALALKKQGLTSTVIGCGRSEQRLEIARQRRIIDAFTTDPAQACRQADLVLLATPVDVFTDTLRQIGPVLKPGSLVTDVGSVKGQLVHQMEQLLPDSVWFVGAHPIAGGEKSGIDAARADLFCGERCIVTPTAHSRPAAVELVVELWKKLGMQVECIDPEAHDRIYAQVSHLPHLVAYALVNAVQKNCPAWPTYAGSGFKDTTRIALSSPDLWQGIALSNRENLLAAARDFRAQIDNLIAALESGQAGRLGEIFAQAQAARMNLPETTKNKDQ